jgi:succinyl-diaminopimelate desuccinylase
MGSMHARVVFEGQAAHSARPWQGDNAIHAAGKLLTALAERQPQTVHCHGFPFKEVLSATLAKGGSGRNVIPDYFELNLNYRFAPGKSLAIAEAELRSG